MKQHNWAASIPQNCSKRFYTFPLYEAPSHALINVWSLLLQMSTTAYSQVLIHKKHAQGLTLHYRIRTQVSLVGSLKLYPRTIALYFT